MARSMSSAVAMTGVTGACVKKRTCSSGVGVERIGHGDHEPAVDVAERHDARSCARARRAALSAAARRSWNLRQIDERNAELLAQHEVELVAREKPEVDEDLAEVLLLVVALELERDVELLAA